MLLTYSIVQSISFNPLLFKKAFVLENGLLPKKSEILGIMRKQNVISDVQLMNLRDRGDVVAPLMFH